jgi:hypothetical protein
MRIAVIPIFSALLCLPKLAAVDDHVQEIVVQTDDGTFTMRDVQFIGRGAPEFTAKVYNGLGHDWKVPRFSITYDGHDPNDASKQIHQAFTVDGMCVWPKGHECTLFKYLDFALFVIDKYDFKLVGGIRTPSDADNAAEAERKQLADAEQAKKDEEQTKKEESDAARRKKLAAEQRKRRAEEEALLAKIRAEQDAKEATERAKLKATCRLVYQSTIDKKQGDLTVREAEQIRACQSLNFYPPD